MKRFFDVYIRLAGAAVDWEGIDSGKNPLDGWDRLELLDAKAKLTLEGDQREIGDGTSLTTGEKVAFECATLRADATEWDYLRSTFGNKLCDIIFYDPASNELLLAAYGLRLQVTALSESSEPVLFKITGSRSFSSESTVDHVVLANAQIEESVGLLSGTILDQDDAPLAGVTVTMAAQIESPPAWTDVTDKDGHYYIVAPAGGYEIAFAKTGYVFADTALSPGNLSIIKDQEVVYNALGEEET